jgi:hypothetical protein
MPTKEIFVMGSDDSVLGDYEEEVWPQYLGFQDVVDHINFAGLFQVWVELSLVDIPYQASRMKDMGVTAFGLALEHHASILQLVKSGNVGSAAALSRPLFETFVRGLWLIKIDDPQKLKNFEDDRDSRDPEKLIKDLIDIDGSKKYADLLNSWVLSKKALHSFVHSRFEAIFRRSNQYQPEAEDIVSMLGFSTGVAVNAVLELLDFLKSNLPPELVADVNENQRIADIEERAWSIQKRLVLSEKAGTEVLRIKLVD